MFFARPWVSVSVWVVAVDLTGSAAAELFDKRLVSNDVRQNIHVEIDERRCQSKSRIALSPVWRESRL